MQGIYHRNGGIAMLDKTTVINTVERYADVVVKKFSPSAVVLFGSYVNGTPHEDSDIDVGVVFDGFNGNWLETSTQLWGLTEDISFDIEPILLDTAQDESGFVKHVFKTGKVIYKA